MKGSVGMLSNMAFVERLSSLDAYPSVKDYFHVGIQCL